MADTHPITVAVAPHAMEKMKARVAELKFADVETYLLYLIAIDIADDKTYAADLMKRIYQAEATGPGRVADEGYYRELTERTDKVIREAAAKSKQQAAG